MFGFIDFRVHGEENWRLKISPNKIGEDDAVKGAIAFRHKLAFAETDPPTTKEEATPVPTPIGPCKPLQTNAFIAGSISLISKELLLFKSNPNENCSPPFGHKALEERALEEIK